MRNIAFETLIGFKTSMDHNQLIQLEPSQLGINTLQDLRRLTAAYPVNEQRSFVLNELNKLEQECDPVWKL